MERLRDSLFTNVTKVHLLHIRYKELAAKDGPKQSFSGHQRLRCGLERGMRLGEVLNDGADELVRSEGLGEDGHCAELHCQGKRIHDRRTRRSGHGNNSRLGRTPADFHHRFQAVLFGQNHIHDDHVKGLLAAGPRAFVPARHGYDLVAGLGQGSSEKRPHLALVVYNQHASFQAERKARLLSAGNGDS